MTRSKISALFAVGALCLLAAIPGAHARLGGNAGDFLQGGLLGSVGEGIGKGFGDKLGSLLGGAIVGTCECAHGGGAFGTCKESSLFAGNGGLQADCTKQGAEDTCEGQKNLVGKSFCKWKPSKLSGTVADVTKDLDPRNWGKMLGLERRLSGKKCGNAAGEAACIAACASVAGIPICLSDACYGPNGPDFSPSCGKDDHRRLAVGIFDKKPEGAICTYTPDCQGNLECYAAEMVGPIQVSRCQKSEGRRLAVGFFGDEVGSSGIFDKKPEGSYCTFSTDCQGNLECIHGNKKRGTFTNFFGIPVAWCMDCEKSLSSAAQAQGDGCYPGKVAW